LDITYVNLVFLFDIYIYMQMQQKVSNSKIKIHVVRLDLDRFLKKFDPVQSSAISIGLIYSVFIKQNYILICVKQH